MDHQDNQSKRRRRPATAQNHTRTRTGGLKHRPPGTARSKKADSASSKTTAHPANRRREDSSRVQAQKRVRTTGNAQPKRRVVHQSGIQQRRRANGQTQKRRRPGEPSKRKASYTQQQKSNNHRHPQRSNKRSSQRRPSRPSQPRVKKRSFVARHKKGFATFILILAAIIAGFFFYLTRTAPIVFGSDARGISSDAATQARHHRIVNVLLLGTDSRNSNDAGRSDTMMILTGDFEHKKLKITSLLRDTYVEIPDHDMNKLNAAYSFGASGKSGNDAINSAANAAIRTVNHNFDTAITEYIEVDFTCTSKIVDAVGGVDITLKSDAERQLLNKYLNDTKNESGGAISSNPVSGTGKKHLDGAQALAYSRIRYVGNGDFERTQRQRTVFEQVFKKAKKMNIFKQLHLYNTVKPYIHTSLSNFQLFKLLFNVALTHSTSLEQQQMPDSTQVSVGMLHGVSYVFPKTLYDNVRTLHDFIYEETYEPSTTVKDISDKIQTTWPY